MTEPRYLPLFTEGGAWIERPDLYLYARLSRRDNDTGEESVDQLYHHLTVNTDNTRDTLSDVDVLIKRELAKDLTGRHLAAMVLDQAVRLKANGVKPSQRRAVELVAHIRVKERPNTALDSHRQAATHAFRDWRNLCHLQLATEIDGAQHGSFENDPERLDAVLRNAKALEMFLDYMCDVEPRLNWNPWRVPAVVQPDLKLSVLPLEKEERRLLRLPCRS